MYIYIYREREMCMYIYIYIYVHTYTYYIRSWHISVREFLAEKSAAESRVVRALFDSS